MTEWVRGKVRALTLIVTGNPDDDSEIKIEYPIL